MGDTRKSAFIVPEKSSLELSPRISRTPLLKIPTNNLATRATCRLKNVFKLSENQTRHSSEFGTCTDKDGHFVPRRGLVLSNRYICVNRIERKGQSAVLITAKDSFQAMESVAIKVMHISYFSIGLKEVDTLRRLNLADPGHVSHTIRLRNAFMYDDHVCLVFPVMNPLPLNRVITDLEFDAEKKLRVIRKVALHLLSALAFLKRSNTFHADVKPENVLVRSPHEAKGDNILDSLVLVDFGNAIHHTHKEVSLYYSNFDLQTLPYRAPEVCVGVPFGVEIDMWSLGCLLAELFTEKILFPGATRISVLRGMTSLLGPLPEVLCRRGKFGSEQEIMELSRGRNCGQKASALDLMSKIPGLRDYSFASFLSGLLNYCPDQRLTPWQALQHPFMAKEICIGHFLPDSSVDQQLVSKSDYNFSQVISSDIKRMCPSTYDILKTGTQQPVQSSCVRRNVARVQPLERSAICMEPKTGPLSDHKRSSPLKTSGSSSKKKKSMDSTFVLSDSNIKAPCAGHFKHPLPNKAQLFENGIKSNIHAPDVKPCVDTTTTIFNEGINFLVEEKKNNVKKPVIICDNALSNRLKERDTIIPPNIHTKEVDQEKGISLHDETNGKLVKCHGSDDKKIDTQNRESCKDRIANSTFTFSQNGINVHRIAGFQNAKHNVNSEINWKSRHRENSVQQSCMTQDPHLNDTFTIGRVKSNLDFRRMSEEVNKNLRQITSDDSKGNINPDLEQREIRVKENVESDSEAGYVNKNKNKNDRCSMSTKNQEIQLDSGIVKYSPDEKSSKCCGHEHIDVNDSLRKNRNGYSLYNATNHAHGGQQNVDPNCGKGFSSKKIRSKKVHFSQEYRSANCLHGIKISSSRHKSDERSCNDSKSSSDAEVPHRSGNEPLTKTEHSLLHFEGVECLQNGGEKSSRDFNNTTNKFMKGENGMNNDNFSVENSHQHKPVMPASCQQSTAYQNSLKINHKRKRKLLDSFCKDSSVEKMPKNSCLQPHIKKIKVGDGVHVKNKLPKVDKPQRRKLMKSKEAVETVTDISHCDMGSNYPKECRAYGTKQRRRESIEKKVDIGPGCNGKSNQTLTSRKIAVKEEFSQRVRQKSKTKRVRRALHFDSVREAFGNHETCKTTHEPSNMCNEKQSIVSHVPDFVPTERKQKTTKYRLLRESLIRDESDEMISDPYNFKVTPKDKRKKTVNQNDYISDIPRRQALQGKARASDIIMEKIVPQAACTIGELVDKKIKCLKMEPAQIHGCTNSKLPEKGDILSGRDSCSSIERAVADNFKCKPMNPLYKPVPQNSCRTANDQQRESNGNYESNRENKDLSLKEDLSQAANINKATEQSFSVTRNLNSECDVYQPQKCKQQYLEHNIDLCSISTYDKETSLAKGAVKKATEYKTHEDMKLTCFADLKQIKVEMSDSDTPAYQYEDTEDDDDDCDILLLD